MSPRTVMNFAADIRALASSHVPYIAVVYCFIELHVVSYICNHLFILVCTMLLRWGCPRPRIARLIIVSGCIQRFLVLCCNLVCF